jgi:hypothetical protein
VHVAGLGWDAAGAAHALADWHVHAAGAGMFAVSLASHQLPWWLLMLLACSAYAHMRARGCPLVVRYVCVAYSPVVGLVHGLLLLPCPPPAPKGAGMIEGVAERSLSLL